MSTKTTKADPVADEEAMRPAGNFDFGINIKGLCKEYAEELEVMLLTVPTDGAWITIIDGKPFGGQPHDRLWLAGAYAGFLLGYGVEDVRHTRALGLAFADDVFERAAAQNHLLV